MIELDFNIQDVFAASLVQRDVVITIVLEVGAQSFDVRGVRCLLIKVGVTRYLY